MFWNADAPGNEPNPCGDESSDFPGDESCLPQQNDEKSKDLPADFPDESDDFSGFESACFPKNDDQSGNPPEDPFKNELNIPGSPVK